MKEIFSKDLTLKLAKSLDMSFFAKVVLKSYIRNSSLWVNVMHCLVQMFGLKLVS